MLGPLPFPPPRTSSLWLEAQGSDPASAQLQSCCLFDSSWLCHGTQSRTCAELSSQPGRSRSLEATPASRSTDLNVSVILGSYFSHTQPVLSPLPSEYVQHLTLAPACQHPHLMEATKSHLCDCMSSSLVWPEACSPPILCQLNPDPRSDPCKDCLSSVPAASAQLHRSHCFTDVSPPPPLQLFL